MLRSTRCIFRPYLACLTLRVVVAQRGDIICMRRVNDDGSWVGDEMAIQQVRVECVVEYKQQGIQVGRVCVSPFWLLLAS